MARTRDRSVNLKNYKENFYICFSSFVGRVYLRFAFYVFSFCFLLIFLLSYFLYVSFSCLRFSVIQENTIRKIYHKINFFIQITNEVVDVEAALKPPEWASRTSCRWRREMTLIFLLLSPYRCSFLLFYQSLLNDSKIYYAILRCLGRSSDVAVVFRNHPRTTICLWWKSRKPWGPDAQINKFLSRHRRKLWDRNFIVVNTKLENYNSTE